MKVTMLTKRISTNVIAATADAALTLLFTQDECKDFSVLNAQIAVITAPDAVKKTIEFAEQSGLYVIGHYPGMLDVNQDLHVWSVTVDLEYAVDFTMPQNQASAPSDGQAAPQEGVRRAPSDGQGTLVRDVWEEPDGSGQWYHRDETEQAHGPFGSREAAYQALREYVDFLEHGPPADRSPAAGNGSGQESAPDLSTEITPE